MHKDWEELIPYYVAGSLSRPEAAHLESHLARCPECRRSVEEWRAVASVVRAQAAAQLRDLPPLSARVMQVATQQAGDRRAPYQRPPLPRRSAQPPSRLRSTSITLIAAVFTVIVFGGLLTIMVLRGVIPQPGAESAVLLPTATSSPTEALLVAPTEALLAAPTIPDTATPAPQIIVIEPSATPDTIPTQPPTVTNPPTQALIFNTPLPTKVPPSFGAPTRVPPTRVPPSLGAPTAAPPPTATDDPLTAFSLLAPESAAGCLLHAATGSPISLYAGAGTQYAVVGSVTQADDLTALAVSGTGWYQAQTPGGLVGWVRADQVYTTGSCDALPVISAAPTQPPPTATAYSGVPVAVVNLDSVNLRSGPGTIYPVVDVVYAGERLPITARAAMSDGAWYLVQRGGGLWVSAGVVQLAPADAIIPLAATMPPSPSPTATVIPFMSTLTPSPGAPSGDVSSSP